MLRLALLAGVSAIALAAGGAGGSPPPSGVGIVGTPLPIPTNGAHTQVNSSAYDHPGGENTGLAVVVSGRPTGGTAQTVTVTWDGVSVPSAVNSSGPSMQANDTFVSIHVLPGAAAGAKVLAVNFGTSQSDSVVTLVSLERLNQADAIGNTNSSAEYASSGTGQSAGVTTTAAGSLVLAGGAIAYSTTTEWAEPFAELWDQITEGGTTSAITQSGAATSPASGATVTAAATFGNADDGRAVAVVELLAA